MNDHNDNGNNDHSSSMMWMMAICCLAPLVFILILGKGLAIQGWLGWTIAIVALAMIIYHFWQMRVQGGHMGSNNDMPGQDRQNINPEQKNTDEHEHH
ncbi:MAG: hypothetical protein WC794_05935 [Candidatus Doudnabacteria bacterium]|jgi:hypothetical protein